MAKDEQTFNIQGIALSKTYSHVPELAAALGLGKLKKTGDSTFQQSIDTDMEEDAVFILHLPQGTLIILGDGMDTQELTLTEAVKQGTALRFLIGEDAEAYAFEYIRDGESIRSVLTAEGEDLLDEGDPLEIEVESDLTDVILNLIGEVTGSDFYKLDPGLKVEEFRVIR